MQRLAIARAIFSESPILILDEATSALDADTERKVLQNIRSMTDKTVIIVSQIFSYFDTGKVCQTRHRSDFTTDLCWG